MSSSLMSSSPLIRWFGLFLTVPLVAWAYACGSGRVYLACHFQVTLRFKLAAGLGEAWCRDGGMWSLWLLFVFPLCRRLENMPMASPQRFADNLRFSSAAMFTVQFVQGCVSGCVVPRNVCPPQYFQSGSEEFEVLGCVWRWSLGFHGAGWGEYAVSAC